VTVTVALYTGLSSDCGCLMQVNGTACAVPRLIIAILENYQQRVSVSQFLFSCFQNI